MSKSRTRSLKKVSGTGQAKKSTAPALLKHAPRNVVAIDLGAESCRVSLATCGKTGATVRTVYSFPNAPIAANEHLYWDLGAIQRGLLHGLALCANQVEGPIASIGVDGWAVDYVRLNKKFQPLANPFCYRDPRTELRQTELWRKITPERIYAITGIQHLRINTLYQLYADHCDGVAPGNRWLNIPEYVLQFLGGAAVSEYTNATHTQMVTAGTREWSAEIFAAAGLDKKTAPEIIPPGTVVGKFSRKRLLAGKLKDTLLVAPACHDTGSAVAGIPAEGEDWAFLSSGTWSLIGAVLPKFCITEAARIGNFSNEGGLGGSVRFLKNVNGMWILRECLRHWEANDVPWDMNTLVAACSALGAPRALFNVDEPALLLPGNMPERINALLARDGSAPLATGSRADCVAFANLIFHSLAARYAELLHLLKSVTGKRLKRLYVVGGGSRNQLLNQLIARQTGLEVIRGPVESSTIGNLAIQYAVLDGARSSKNGVIPTAVAAWSGKLAAAVLG